MCREGTEATCVVKNSPGDIWDLDLKVLLPIIPYLVWLLHLYVLYTYKA